MVESIELLLIFLLLLALTVKPVGLLLLPIAEGRVPAPLSRADAVLMRILGIDPDRGGTWGAYARALIVFNGAGLFLLYAVLRLQGLLPMNPEGFPGLSPARAFNLAVSSVTNTNWTAGGVETSISLFSRMAGFTVQNFASCATGLAVSLVLMRAFRASEADVVGNFWADLVRLSVWVILPLSFVFGLLFVACGVPQTFTASPASLSGELIPLGPVASETAAQLLGTNGGGFFSANSAHPFANPSPLSNFLSVLAMVLIPSGLTWTFGRMAGNAREGWTIWTAMALIFTFSTAAFAYLEADFGGFAQVWGATGAECSLEGKELRLGLAHTSLFTTAATATSCGAVNASLDSLAPLAGMIPALLILLGEVVFGGAGSGFCSMMIFTIVAVFAAGLMVGRTPEYIGKKIDVRAMKLAAIAMLMGPLLVLPGTVASLLTDAGVGAAANPGAHGFTEIFYAWASAANNNGSAFAALDADRTWYHLGLGAAMWIGRFSALILMLALAGVLARSRSAPISSGTLATTGPLFCGLLIGVILLVGVLTYLPALALGPIADHLVLASCGAP